MAPNPDAELEARVLGLSSADPDEVAREIEAIGRHDPELAARVAEALNEPADRPDPLTALVARAAASFAAIGVLLPQDVGPYTLRERLGDGGSGEVFLAEHNVTKQKVAVKVVRIGREDPSTFTEAAILGTLDHPGVARVYGAGDAQVDSLTGPKRVRYIAVEYLPGRSVATHAASLTPASRLALVCQVIEALAFLHASGVVHGDLKPSNVLLTSDGSPRIVDFGVSRVERFGIRTSASGHNAGAATTPGYAAPEVARGQQAPDESSDLYAFGVLALELLARTATRAPTPSTLRAAGFGPAPATALASVLARCLAHDPDQRPRSAAAVRDTFGRITTNTIRVDDLSTSTTAAPLALWAAARATQAARRAASPIIAACSTALVIGLAVIALGPGPATPQPTDAPPAPSPSIRTMEAAATMTTLMARRRDWSGADIADAIGRVPADPHFAAIAGPALFERGQMSTLDRMLAGAAAETTNDRDLRDRLLRLWAYTRLAMHRPRDAAIPTSLITIDTPNADSDSDPDPTTLANLVLLCTMTGTDPRAAEACARLDLITADTTPDWFAVARFEALASAARAKGELQEAEFLLRSAIVARRGHPRPDLAPPLHPVLSLAQILGDTGRPSEAASLIEALLDG